MQTSTCHINVLIDKPKSKELQKSIENFTFSYLEPSFDGDIFPCSPQRERGQLLLEGGSMVPDNMDIKVQATLSWSATPLSSRWPARDPPDPDNPPRTGPFPKTSHLCYYSVGSRILLQ